MVEDLGLAGLGRGDEMSIKDREDILADLGKLVLNLLAVLLDKGDLAGVSLGLLLLLDGGDNAPRGTAGTDDILVGNRKKVSLLDGEITVLRGNNLHVLDHLCGAQALVRILSGNLSKILTRWITYPRSAQPARQA